MKDVLEPTRASAKTTYTFIRPWRDSLSRSQLTGSSCRPIFNRAWRRWCLAVVCLGVHIQD